jgi:cleavage stimulation factor subunit 2
MGGPGPAGGRIDLGMLPPGIELPRGEKAIDQIAKTLASGISPGQLQDVMAGMKVSGIPMYSFFSTYLPSQ